MTALKLLLIAQILISGYSVEGTSEGNVLITNHTGLLVARLVIGERTFESFSQRGDLLIHVSPRKYHMRVIFRGGAESDWVNFDFKNVHEVIFERHKNKITAHYN